MAIGFVDGAYNRAHGTRNAFGALSDALVREGHPAMVSLSGDREPDTQLRLWNERMTLNPGSRRTYGSKWWRGLKWWQIHPDAVGIPGTSNHEARRSNDLKWPYNSDTTASRRAKELGRNHNITREGENFRELWHWTFWGPLGQVDSPSGGGGSGEWDEMATKAEVQQAVADALANTRYGEGNRNLFDLGNDARGFAARALQAAEAGTADKVWSHPVASQDENGRVLEQKYPAGGYLASTNARVGVSPDQVKTIADAVVKQIGAPTVELDYAAIADAVNDEAARRLVS